MQNPLLPEIHQLLSDHPQGIAEYDILKAVKKHSAFVDLAGEGQLPLFHKHFFIMNALYQLQAQVWDEQRQVLEITPLVNKLHSSAPSTGETQLIQAESRGPSEYYLNWDNFHATTETDVSQLYKSFWSFLAQSENRPSALASLDLDPTQEYSAEQITQRYRLLAKQHHPDTGGDAQLFIKIRAAYQALQKHV